MVLFGGDEKKINRIAIDLDTLSLISLSRCILVCWLFGFKEKVTIRYSSSKKGRHFIAWCPFDKSVTFKKLLFIKRLAGDDKYRIKKDSQGRMIQVLFSEKKHI